MARGAGLNREHRRPRPRYLEILSNLAAGNPDGADQAAIRRFQWDAAGEGDEAVIGGFETMSLCARFANFPDRLSLVSKRTDDLALRIATSMEPSQARSMREKALIWPAESRTAMQAATPIIAAFSRAAATRLSACCRVISMPLPRTFSPEHRRGRSGRSRPLQRSRRLPRRDVQSCRSRR